MSDEGVNSNMADEANVVRWRVVKVGGWYYPEFYSDGLWCSDGECRREPASYMLLSHAIHHCRAEIAYAQRVGEVVWESSPQADSGLKSTQAGFDSALKSAQAAVELLGTGALSKKEDQC